ncbi:hypothetical protein BDY19DRAFT_906943 [Irpex rosettiformis]|uniref:Uncharacterized protein n=1 Tax=Irpex rosettiformis TaxID=378272 RepID=A0ACB8U1H6_9APHY|nr:hypothetical protein BDY19DRAFT_906943 [Irpex rosettiformis]
MRHLKLRNVPQFTDKFYIRDHTALLSKRQYRMHTNSPPTREELSTPPLTKPPMARPVPTASSAFSSAAGPKPFKKSKPKPTREPPRSPASAAGGSSRGSGSNAKSANTTSESRYRLGCSFMPNTPSSYYRPYNEMGCFWCKTDRRCYGYGKPSHLPCTNDRKRQPLSKKFQASIAPTHALYTRSLGKESIASRIVSSFPVSEPLSVSSQGPCWFLALQRLNRDGTSNAHPAEKACMIPVLQNPYKLPQYPAQYAKLFRLDLEVDVLIQSEKSMPENTNAEVSSTHPPVTSAEPQSHPKKDHMKLPEDVTSQPVVVAMSDAELPIRLKVPRRHRIQPSVPRPARTSYNLDASEPSLHATSATTIAGNTSIVKPKPSIKLVGTQAS